MDFRLKLYFLVFIALFVILGLSSETESRHISAGARFKRLALPQFDSSVSFPSQVHHAVDQHTSHWLPVRVRNYLKENFMNGYKDAWKEFYNRQFSHFGTNKYSSKFP